MRPYANGDNRRAACIDRIARRVFAASHRLRRNDCEVRISHANVARFRRCSRRCSTHFAPCSRYAAGITAPAGHAGFGGSARHVACARRGRGGNRRGMVGRLVGEDKVLTVGIVSRETSAFALRASADKPAPPAAVPLAFLLNPRAPILGVPSRKGRLWR